MQLPNLQYLNSLQLLDCSHNYLCKLPSFLYLSSLQLLDCSYNELREPLTVSKMFNQFTKIRS